MEDIVRHTISDLYKTLDLTAEQEIGFTVLSVPDIHPQIPFKSEVLRADYFSFILTKEGSGVYYLDEHIFPFHSGSIYFTNPGHVKSYELHDSKEAYIIILTEDFLRENVYSEIYDEFPFLLAEIAPPKTADADTLREFENLYKQIFDEFEKTSIYKNNILGKLFYILLLKLKEVFWFDYNPITEGNRNSQIVKSFKQILESEFKKITDYSEYGTLLQVQDFAERLSLHPNYLNSVIKAKTGRTINEWISKRTLSCAKTLLKNSSLSAKEIAYRLGYSEPTHFNRFFKKHQNITPGAFRKKRNL